MGCLPTKFHPKSTKNPQIPETQNPQSTYRLEEDFPNGGNAIQEEEVLSNDDRVIAGERVKALYLFNARSPKELSFNKDDTLLVLSVEDDDWIKALDEINNRQGYVPLTFVAHVESLDIYDWYFGSMNRRTAISELMRRPDGTFLVRESSTPGDFALSVKYSSQDDPKQVKHFQIKYNNYKYSIWNKKKYSTLNDCIEDIKQSPEMLMVRLTQACLKAQPMMSELSVETKDEWEIDRKEITLEQIIGTGNFGKVYYGKWKNYTEVAIKVLKKGSMTEEEFLSEASIMKGLKHVNIVGLLATCSKDHEGPIYIITLYMKNGSLLKLLKEHREQQSLTHDQMMEFAFQISKGMAYLEQKNLVHRDLAARNVLVDEQFTCKIADFGLSKLLQGKNEENIYGGKLPVKWSPPEAWQSIFSTKSDVWSFGVVLYEVFTYGGSIYQGMSHEMVKQKVRTGYRLSKPQTCLPWIYELMLKCWDVNPRGRPPFYKLVSYFDDARIAIRDGTLYLGINDVMDLPHRERIEQ